jgi:N-acetylmuramic acid 6-phosphate etherase
MGMIPKGKLAKDEIKVPVKLPHTYLDLLSHMMVKVGFNLISTGTMAKMGRVWGNWMIQVFPTNKKLIDRSTRIIANLADIPYKQANEEFFYTVENRPKGEEYKESYVVETLRRLGFDPYKQR